MRIPFRQGIVSFSPADFIQVSLPNVNLVIGGTPVTIAFASGPKDFLWVEKQSVAAAWKSIPSATDVWLYWDIDTRTAARTFGFTRLNPIVGTEPTAPALDQHWYDSSSSLMKVWTGQFWLVKNRVFACKLQGGVTPLSVSANSPSFVGTQVGDNAAVFAGSILFDSENLPLKTGTGKFVTTEDRIRTPLQSTADIRISALSVEARAAQPLARFTVVKFIDFGEINYADKFISSRQDQFGMIEVDAVTGDLVNVVTSGLITSLDWDWTTIGVSQPLYNDDTGQLKTSQQYPEQPPIAMVVDKHTILLGSPRVSLTQNVQQVVDGILATSTSAGGTKLSVAPSVPTNPIAVGDNDPRMTDARTPLAHTHTIASITDLASTLAQYLTLSGGTLTGNLTLSADPTVNLHAATKHYVDTAIAAVATTGGVVSSVNTKVGAVVLAASDIGITDSGNIYAATTVEGAFSEVMSKANSTASSLSSLQSTVSAITPGETNTGANLGTGNGVYASKSGAALQFKSIIAGTNVSITNTANDITISATGTGEANTGANLGAGTVVYASKSGTTLQFKTLIAGSNVSITNTANDITISAATGESNTGSNLGAGTGVYAAKSGIALQFKSLIAGSNISISNTANDITIAATNIGEANTASNQGTGTGVFAQKSGVDLQFRTIKAGSNVTVTNTATEITVAASNPGETNTASNLGVGTGVFAQKSGVDLQFKTLVAGTNVTLSNDATTVTINATGGGGSGNVVGPATSTNNAFAQFNGTTGTLLKDSGVTLVTSVANTVNTTIPTEGAVKTYVTSNIAALSGTPTFSNFAYTRLHNSTNQPVVTSTWVTLGWDTGDLVATGSWTSGDNTKIVIPAGVFRARFTAYINWTNNSANTRFVQLLKNGTAPANSIAVDIRPAAFESGQQVMSEWLDVVPGDYFIVQANQTSGGTLSVSSAAGAYGGRSHFSVELSTTSSAPGKMVWNAQVANYTMALSDAQNGIVITSASANALTVPLSSAVAFPIGSNVYYYQGGAGITTITPAAGVTLNVRSGLSLTTTGQNAWVRLLKTDTDTWLVTGDLTTTASGSGTITGPGTSVVNNLAAWNNTTGTTLKDSGVAVTTTVSSSSSVSTLPSEGAVKTYVDQKTQVTGSGTVWNSSAKGASVTLSNNNLTASSNYTGSVRATAGVSSGKYYWEISGASDANAVIGVGNTSALVTGTAVYPGSNANSWGMFLANGQKYNNGTSTAYVGSAVASSAVIGVLLDMDAGTLSYTVNGVSYGIAFTGITGVIYPMYGGGSSGAATTVTANFGATSFVYTVPIGYTAGIGTISTLKTYIDSKPTSIPIAASDETTALTTGSAKVTLRMPYAMTLTKIKGSLTTAQATGSVLTVDVKKNGTSVFSTTLTFNNTSKTTVGATTAAVLSSTALADDDEITIDIAQVGDGTAKGLKIYLIGTV